MFDNIQPVTLSERACAEIRHIMQTKGIPVDYGLRVGIRGAGGCGVSLIIGFDKKRSSDIAYDVSGIPVFVDKKHTMYLIGKQVDFVDSDEGRGFTFNDVPAQK
jgi:iron-sulfur cluster assembly protein